MSSPPVRRRWLRGRWRRSAAADRSPRIAGSRPRSPRSWSRVVVLAVQGRLSDSRVGQPSAAPASVHGVGQLLFRPRQAELADALRHAWQRPLPVAPGPDVYGSGFLSVTGATGSSSAAKPGPDASQAAIAVAGPDTLLVTATAATTGMPARRGRDVPLGRGGERDGADPDAAGRRCLPGAGESCSRARGCERICRPDPGGGVAARARDLHDVGVRSVR